MSPDSSNIRVFVRWDDDSTIFSGEAVQCTICFKNIASAGPNTSSSTQSQLKPPPNQYRTTSSHPSSRLAPPPSTPTSTPASRRGHRPTSSLTISPSNTAKGRAGSIPWVPPSHPPDFSQRNGNAHRRSVSIVSIGSVSSVDSHATHPQRPFHSPSSPLYNASYPPDKASPLHRPPGVSTAPTTPNIDGPSSPRTPAAALSEFKFPMAPSPLADGAGASSKTLVQDGAKPSSTSLGEPAIIPMRSKDPIPIINEQITTPVARVLSTTSVAGTPRSSGEFYSMSNNSTETLVSEYAMHPPMRTHGRPSHLRQRSTFSPQKAKRPEALMMGFAQVQGSFTLDGSLVSLAPFEEVKRKAVVGGQGGGVVGIETSKRESGFMRGFGWGSFTNSIGELLGAGELSTIKEMRGVASSKSVPLLSTPQSVLFVDLTLAPGESKAFEYTFRLPKGLPPTHRGKAMKISYSLIVGTQRPGGAKEQQVKSVEIPFRVLGSVNSHGEILGHDLKSPYIMLRDQASIRSIEKRGSLYANRRSSDAKAADKNGKGTETRSSMNDFLSYADELVHSSRLGPGAGLLSPTATTSSRRLSAFEEATTAKEAIDLAIIRSNLTTEGQQSANRFEIARNGRRVGVVMLARPAYRLGEVVTMAVDFTGAEIPCYAVHAALETSERVDPSLAMRSEASIHRASRKVHVSSSEATLFSRRMIFSPTIPVTATPEFVTSGISLEWKIRLEFVVPSQDAEARTIEEQPEDDEYNDDGSGQERLLIPEPKQQTASHPLLEEIARDDRGGLVLVAAENLVCESFEVAVPLRVYGAVCKGLERLERDEALEEGLVV
ncbi:Rgp1-domain-containing protein [Cryphonectria parasitica EP155]|uniref:Rgp1-domain-containing protein n=1 Tax=Cryphonectria parasitica (strain ATCC 38755 / EP155) TaxID=660469 RepID=A0A9P5CQ60_CRYP1|nr:Rgp1-domain-containing protein [Cryphonectria parasitica EP155]KAF3765906.1 Rgp1-domain-containing protein [Cryphonectria parasitica EP155]